MTSAPNAPSAIAIADHFARGTGGRSAAAAPGGPDGFEGSVVIVIASSHGLPGAGPRHRGVLPPPPAEPRRVPANDQERHAEHAEPDPEPQPAKHALADQDAELDVAAAAVLGLDPEHVAAGL